MRPSNEALKKLPLAPYLAIAAVALVVLAIAGCSNSDTQVQPAPEPTAAQAPDPTPSARAPQPSPTPATATDPDPDPQASATPVPTPAGATGDTLEEDPATPYFDIDRVLDIRVEMSPSDWDELRSQSRTLEDVMTEIELYDLSRPFSDIYTWFSATVTVDGETLTDVGIRKKGFVGSHSDTKPALKLRFNRNLDDQFLGGVIDRMTLNNSVQDPSLLATCLAHQLFTDAGLPSSRCNFAKVTLNGMELGLYVNLEELKAPFLVRHFGSADGNLYEGTVSDFTPQFRGTIEKKTNEDDNDWSDVDAVVAALQDRSERGLDALSEIVDLDNFLSYWAMEVLVGQWDGYAGNRNNFQFYREPGGRFVFLPWGLDQAFQISDDPNPFDDISDPPPSVLALTEIPNRLYNHPGWRQRYVTRLQELLDLVWDEDEIASRIDRMAATVQAHATEAERSAAAADTARVRKFVLMRRGEILADITPSPPDWPEPEGAWSGSVAVDFETVWLSNQSPDPIGEGKVLALTIDGLGVPTDGIGVVAGPSSPEERTLLPDAGDVVSIAIIGMGQDGSVSGVTLVLPLASLTEGLRLVIGQDPLAAVSWTIPPGASAPDSLALFTSGELELLSAGTETGDVIAGSFSGSFGVASSLPATGLIEARFTTDWGSNGASDPFAEGEMLYLGIDGRQEAIEGVGAVAGYASPSEYSLLPGADKLASITALRLETDGWVRGFTIVLPLSSFIAGNTFEIGLDTIAGGVWVIPPGAIDPSDFRPFASGTLRLLEAGTEPGSSIEVSFLGYFGESLSNPPDTTGFAGLTINEVAAAGDPLDWFELHNASDDDMDLSSLLMADDLDDASKRVSFPAGLKIPAGGFLQVELDKDGWPGFALGRDEELGVWTMEGVLVDWVDWDEGDAGEGISFARTPDGIGEFRSVDSPTPGATNADAD